MIETYYKVPSRYLENLCEYIVEEGGTRPDFIYFKSIEPGYMDFGDRNDKLILLWSPITNEWRGKDRPKTDSQIATFKYKMLEWQASEISEETMFLELL